MSAQDGRRLYFRDYGDPNAAGTALFCLPGLTRNSKDFDGLARRHATNRRVVCPDYRGRGRSDYEQDWRNYRPRVILNDLFHLLCATDLHRIVVCGISFGGCLAMGLAVIAPSALAGVILDDVGPDIEASGSERIRGFISRDRPQPDWDAAIGHLKAHFRDLSITDDEGWRRFAEATYREGIDGRLHYDWDISLARTLTEASEHPEDLWSLFGALRHIPLLVVRGGNSDVLSAATLARMADEIPDLEQITLPGVGHAPSLEEPQTERMIDDFLERIDNRRA